LSQLSARDVGAYDSNLLTTSCKGTPEYVVVDVSVVAVDVVVLVVDVVVDIVMQCVCVCVKDERRLRVEERSLVIVLAVMTFMSCWLLNISDYM